MVWLSVFPFLNFETQKHREREREERERERGDFLHNIYLYILNIRKKKKEFVIGCR